MHVVFLASFIAGLAATFVGALFSGIGGHIGATHALPAHHGGGAAHLPGHGVSPQTGSHGVPAGSHASLPVHGVAGRMAALSGQWALAWVNPLVLAGGATCFGAAGLVAGSALSTQGLVLAIACVVGLLGAVGVQQVFVAFVRASVPPLSATEVGAIGTVIAPIRADRPGQVIYQAEGSERSLIARSTTGQAIPRGTQVVIVRRERGIALVEPINPLTTLPESQNSS